jgi:hypothetical protein
MPETTALDLVIDWLVTVAPMRISACMMISGRPMASRSQSITLKSRNGKIIIIIDA